MTDDQEGGELFKHEPEIDCLLNNFSHIEKQGAKYYLQVIKHGKMFSLLSSDDQ